MAKEDYEGKLCSACTHPFVVWEDIDGVWVECPCSAGYVD